MPGCCPGGRRSNRARGGRVRRRRAAARLAGADGIVALLYVGPNGANQTYRGAATGTRYLFGARKTGNVDARDVPGLLALRGKRDEPLFAEA